MIQNTKHVFSSAFWPVFAFMYLPTPLVLLVRAGISGYFSPYAFMSASIGAAIFCLVFVIILSVVFKVDIDEGGINCYNVWGVYSYVRWDEIDSLKSANILFLRYVRVFPAKGGFPLWVPLFLNRQSEFEQLVIRFAPADNRLRRYFEMGI